jgi:hypothetical protein
MPAPGSPRTIRLFAFAAGVALVVGAARMLWPDGEGEGEGADRASTGGREAAGGEREPPSRPMDVAALRKGEPAPGMPRDRKRATFDDGRTALDVPLPAAILEAADGPRVKPPEQRAAARATLEAAIPALSPCWDAVKKRSRSSRGTAYVDIVVGDDGGLERSSVQVRGVGEAALQACFQNGLQAIDFSALPAGTHVFWPLRLDAEGGISLR